jgi:Uma2 family endonuclease
VLGDLSEPVPDISILQWKEDYYATQLPGASDIRLIIEVAGSSMEYDRSIKLNSYASAGIPEYWIVDLDRDGVEQYRRPENGMYQEKIILSDHDSISSNLLSGQVAIADLLI